MNFKNIKSVWPVILPLILVTLGIVIIFFAFGAKPLTVSRLVESGQYETELNETSDQGSALGSKNVIPQGESVKVVRVVDGDTIELEGGQTIRYIGIDTPETVHPQKTVEC